MYANRIGSYTKALPHNSFGEVTPAAYSALIKALSTGDPADFENVPLGGVVKQADPQAAFAFGLEGADSHCLGVIAAPSFSSAEAAAEMVELYWQALSRDVPFANFYNDPLINAASLELSTLSDFRGPCTGGQVTIETLFRGNTPGDLTGPYISQFLWKDFCTALCHCLSASVPPLRT